MKNKTKNWFLILMGSLTMVSCFSIGFAAWVIPVSGDNTYLNGDIDRDEYADSYVPMHCITDISFTTPEYITGYGFIDPTTSAIVNTANITGKFNFSVASAKTCINSLDSTNKYFSLKVEFTASLTTNFTFGTPSIGGFSNTPVSKTVTGSTATKAIAYNITFSAAEYSSITLQNLTFSVSLTYSGTSFPNLGSATYSITFTPGEYIAS